VPRLFVAVWPPPEVLDVVRALPRVERPGVRWTRPDQWHVTLRFLGSVDDAGVAAVAAALATAAASVRPPVEASLGSAVARLGRGVVCIDVAGLAAVAAAVVEATAGFGRPPEDRPFHGHLTLARVKPGTGGVRSLGVSGTPVAAPPWRVEAIDLVESQLHPHGARYRSVASFPLGPPGSMGT
jgi:2'-5' RNA ligase